MKTTIKTVFLAAGLAALAAPVAAQSANPATPKPTERAAIQPRKKHPQKHIAHRVQSGNLTAGEGASLERKEAGLNTEERDVREDNRGRMTSARRAQLHHPNHVSKALGQHSHTTAATKKVSRQHRAAELKTGQLTTRQASHLETKEASLHHQIHRRRKQDSNPTSKNKEEEQAQTNQQNTNANQILKKHNARMF